MANSNFVVHNGLTVGPLTIDATTGSITTPGTVTVTGGLAVSTISKNDSSISINDTGTGSNVSISIDGVTEHTLTSTLTTLATALTVSGAITVPSFTKSGTTGVGDIGQTDNTFATVYATTFSGVSTTAKYADLAENYQADSQYEPGTVVEFGGAEEVTIATAGTKRIAGVVSTNPAHLMNGGLNGRNVVALALQGRVPCRVVGPVAKGDLMVSAGFGYAKADNDAQTGQVIGKALADFTGTKGQIEVVVGRV